MNEEIIIAFTAIGLIADGILITICFNSGNWIGVCGWGLVVYYRITTII